MMPAICDELQETHVGNTPIFRTTFFQPDGSILPIDSVITQEYRFRDPDDNVYDLPAIFCTDGTDGVNQVKALPTFLLLAGVWRYQRHLIFPDRVWRGNFTEFSVLKNL